MTILLALIFLTGNNSGPIPARWVSPSELEAGPSIARADLPVSPCETPGSWFEEDRDRPESESEGEEDDPESFGADPIPPTASCLCWSIATEGALIDTHPPLAPEGSSRPPAILRC